MTPKKRRARLRASHRPPKAVKTVGPRRPPANLSMDVPDLSVPRKPDGSNRSLGLRFIFARYFDGSPKSTIDRMIEDGYRVRDYHASNWLTQSDVQQAILRWADTRKNVWGKDQLRAFWTRVASASEVISYREGRKLPDGSREQIPVYPSLRERIKASELLARSGGMFLDRVEHSVDVSIVSLLDRDLAATIDVQTSTSEDSSTSELLT